MIPKNLNDLLTLELQDIYSADLQLTQAIPQISESTTSQALKEELTKHLSETRQQITKLEKISRDLNIDPEGKHCIGMEGIIEEVVELLQEIPRGIVLDTAITAVLQKAEHYKIAGFKTAAEFASTLGHHKLHEKLLETLDEELAADHMLTHISETHLNLKALSPKKNYAY